MAALVSGFFTCGTIAESPEYARCLRHAELNGYGEEKDSWFGSTNRNISKVRSWYSIPGSLSLPQKIEVLVDQHINQFAASDKKTLPRNLFEPHLSSTDKSLENLRWYFKSLVEWVTRHSNRVVASTVGRAKITTTIDVEINFDHRQTPKIIEDRVLDLITVFESMFDTLGTLNEEYQFLSHASSGQ